MTFSFPISSISFRLQSLSVFGSIILLLVIIYLIRRGRLKEGYSLIWFGVSAAMVILSIFEGLLNSIARLVGISYAPAVLFLIMVIGLFILAIHFSLLFTRYDRRIRAIAQEYAILKSTLDIQNHEENK